MPQNSTGAVSGVTIEETRALSYRFSQGRQSARFTNYIVQLSVAAPEGEKITGVGESQPRGHQTGDELGQSWSFLEHVVSNLQGETLNTSDGQLGVTSVRRIMARLYGIAEEWSNDAENSRPFAGSLLGVETALLDLLAKLHGIKVAELIGASRQRVPLISPEIKDLSTLNTVLPKGKATKLPYATTRVKLPKSHDKSENLLKRTIRRLQKLKLKSGQKSLWLNFSGTPDRLRIEETLSFLASEVQIRNFADVILLQDAISKDSDWDEAALRSIIKEVCESVDLNPDRFKILESRVALTEAHKSAADGADENPDALILKPAQFGGLLPTLDAAHALYKERPDAFICLSRMPGASKLSTAAIRHLALTLPRMDAVILSPVAEQSVPFTESGTDTEGTGPAYLQSSAQVGVDWQNASQYSSVKGVRSLGVAKGLGFGMGINYQELINNTLELSVTPPPPPLTYKGKPANVYEDVDFIRPIGSYAVHGHIVEREALARGLNTRRFHKRKFFVTDGESAPLPFQTSRWPLSSVTASAVARHKEAVRIRLGRLGHPVPTGRTFSPTDVETAVKFADRIGYPVVLKPAEGSMGIGVTANIPSAEGLREAYRLLQQSRLANTEFIVEKHVHGNDYRIMVANGEVIAAIQRLPAFVQGDGKSSVAELILQKNAIKRRNPHLGPLKIKWSPSTEYALTKAGYNADSIIETGETVFLANANNLSQGGDSIDVLDEMHPSILQASIDAVNAIPGLAYCGVDFLLGDHSLPIDEQEAAICELNAQASVPVGEYPMFGTPRKMAERFLMECVESFGLKAAPPSDSLNLKMIVRGKVTGVGYRKWFANRAASFECAGNIRNVNSREVEIRVSGSTPAVSALATAAILGPRRALPTSVRTTHLSEPLHGTFEIR